MRHLHFDCFSGISGDMTLGALVDAGLSLKELVRALKDLPATGYRLRSRSVMRGGLAATKVDVVIQKGFRSPLPLSRIQRLITNSRLPPTVRDQSMAVFDRLANAEGLAHRVTPSKVIFHEVGVVDSLIDVIGSIMGAPLLLFSAQLAWGRTRPWLPGRLARGQRPPLLRTATRHGQGL